MNCVDEKDLPPLSAAAKKRLQNLKDEDIDYSDIPALQPNEGQDAVRGRFYRPVKKAISLRIDADVLAWLKSMGDGYQTRINSILREAMTQTLNQS